MAKKVPERKTIVEDGYFPPEAIAAGKKAAKKSRTSVQPKPKTANDVKRSKKETISPKKKTAAVPIDATYANMTKKKK